MSVKRIYLVAVLFYHIPLVYLTQYMRRRVFVGCVAPSGCVRLRRYNSA